MSRSAMPFCQGERAAIGQSRIPMVASRWRTGAADRPRQNQSIDRTEVGPAWRSPPQYGQLMAENQNLDLEPRPRFKQRCDKTDDEAYGDHSLPV
jgi:hypothetical protein